MFIGTVSELTGATRKAIRYYESIKLIPPPKRHGGYRVYDDSDVKAIRLIRCAQSLGFSLSELKDVISKRISSDTFPLKEVCDLIDDKIKELEVERYNLSLKEDSLKKLKYDLVESNT